MSVIATALKHMLAAGMDRDAIVAAVADMEANAPKDAQAERRRLADKERKRLRKSAESAESAEQVSPKKETSPTPLKEKTTPSISEATASSSVAAETDLAFDAWDGMASQANLAKVRVRSKERRAKLAIAIRQHGLPVLLEAIAKVGSSSFCRGENDRGWRADLDFILQPKTFGRLLEGHYDDRQGAARASPPKPGNASEILRLRRLEIQQQANSDDERPSDRPRLIAAR